MRRIVVRLYLSKDLDLIQLYLHNKPQFSEDLLNALRSYIAKIPYHIKTPLNYQPYMVDRRIYEVRISLDETLPENQEIFEFLKQISKGRINAAIKTLYRESINSPFLLPYMSWNESVTKLPPEHKRKRKSKKKQSVAPHMTHTDSPKTSFNKANVTSTVKEEKTENTAKFDKKDVIHKTKDNENKNHMTKEKPTPITQEAKPQVIPKKETLKTPEVEKKPESDIGSFLDAFQNL